MCLFVIAFVKFDVIKFLLGATYTSSLGYYIVSPYGPNN